MMARQSSGFLLPRERERLDKKRKGIVAEEEAAPSLALSEPPPPGFPPSQPPVIPQPPLPDYPPSEVQYSQPPGFPPTPSLPAPGYPPNVSNQQYPPVPILNPMLFYPQTQPPHPNPHHPHPHPYAFQPARTQQPSAGQIQANPHFPPQFSPLLPPNISNPHYKPKPQQIPPQPYQPNPNEFSQAFPSSPYLPQPNPNPTSPTKYPASTSLNPSSPLPPARRIPEYAAILAECLRNGITDPLAIYGKLCESYEQIRKEPRPREESGGAGGGERGGERGNGSEGFAGVDDCDDRMLQEMMHLMSAIPLSPVATQRPKPLLRGVITGNGELMNSDCDLIIHCCNCYHKMGAGIAKSISEKYPCVAEADRQSPKGHKGKLGHFTSALTEDGKTFVNLYAQYHYGNNDGQRKLSYKALKLGLSRLVDRLKSQNAFPKVGSYYMGCYHAGGDKERVKQIFNEVFDNMPIYVFSQITFTDPARQITNKFYNYNVNQKTPAQENNNNNNNVQNSNNTISNGNLQEHYDNFMSEIANEFS